MSSWLLLLPAIAFKISSFRIAFFFLCRSSRSSVRRSYCSRFRLIAFSVFAIFYSSVSLFMFLAITVLPSRFCRYVPNDILHDSNPCQRHLRSLSVFWLLHDQSGTPYPAGVSSQSFPVPGLLQELEDNSVFLPFPLRFYISCTG